MKTLKLVLGILSLVLAAMVLFQSCAAGFVNSVTENGESSGTAGMFVALGMIAGGIVMIVTRASDKKGGSIACLILYGLAAVIGLTSAGSFGDLYIWSGLCAVIAVVNIVALVKLKGEKPAEEEKKE